MNSNRMGAFVSSSEIDRFTLHQTLRGLMPEEVAATLMSHLPPAGWSDVAIRSEVNAKFDAVYSRFDQVDKRFDRMDAKFADLASMKRYVVTTGIALAALIIGFGFATLDVVA
jgi:DNA-binding GntR family transcriptional regulator